MNVRGIQLKVVPAYRLYINNLYYVTYCILKLVLEMTSNSQTCFKSRGQSIEKCFKIVLYNCWYCMPDDLFTFAVCVA